MKTACAQCPFRVGSDILYDENALEALDSGHEPACHMVVGRSSLFSAVFPSDAQVCAGYGAWIDGEPGFCRPPCVA